MARDTREFEGGKVRSKIKLDAQRAVQAPASVFGDPMDVVSSRNLSTQVKREILQQWEQDARELLVAEEENMAGGEPARLARVRAALRALGADRAPARGTDTKLG